MTLHICYILFLLEGYDACVSFATNEEEVAPSKRLVYFKHWTNKSISQITQNAAGLFYKP